MIVYSDKQVICVKDIPSNFFSEAIFILKSNVVEHLEEETGTKTREILLREAEEIVENYREKMHIGNDNDDNDFLRNQRRKKEWIYVGGLLIILAICLTFVIFK